jgi:hypothetical protein
LPDGGPGCPDGYECVWGNNVDGVCLKSCGSSADCTPPLPTCEPLERPGLSGMFCQF